jgi:hypothetical protein
MRANVSCSVTNATVVSPVSSFWSMYARVEGSSFVWRVGERIVQFCVGLLERMTFVPAGMSSLSMIQLYHVLRDVALRLSYNLRMSNEDEMKPLMSNRFVAMIDGYETFCVKSVEVSASADGARRTHELAIVTFYELQKFSPYTESLKRMKENSTFKLEVKFLDEVGTIVRTLASSVRVVHCKLDMSYESGVPLTSRVTFECLQLLNFVHEVVV